MPQRTVGGRPLFALATELCKNLETEVPEIRGGLNWSVQHHLIMNSFSKGGVYGTRKTGQAFRGAEDGHVAPLEGGRVVA
jgi:hypothetical protein